MNDAHSALCRWCQVRYWMTRLRRTPFHPCEPCQQRLRVAQRAWKSWSMLATTGSRPAAANASPHRQEPARANGPAVPKPTPTPPKRPLAMG